MRNKILTAVNLFGLSIGLAAVVLIFIYVYGELSYDDFHENKTELYRVSIKSFREGKLEGESPEFTPPLGPAILKDIPEVKNFARISTGEVGYMADDREPLKVEGLHYADPSLFQLFSFPFLKGDTATALNEPYSIVLTEQIAKKIFGKNNPLGKTVRIDNRQDYTVTGIVKDVPLNSTIQFTALISFVSLYKNPDLYLDWNGGNRYITYVWLPENVDPKQVEQKLPSILSPLNKLYAKSGARLEAYLQPVTTLHLYHEYNSASQRANMYIFSFIAIFILLIACVNFINLSTAGASKRSKEVGVRKVLGADRKKLITQFLLESLLLTLVAFTIAVLLVLLSAPLYEQVFGKVFMLPPSFSLSLVTLIVLVFVVVGVGIGIYPALYLARFESIRCLKGAITREGKPYLRNFLVVTQFSISIVLVAGTIIIYQQQQYIRNKNLGFSRDNIVVLPLVGQDAQTKYSILKQEFGQIPGVQSVAASSEIPYRGFTSNGYKPEGVESSMMIHVVDVDEDFLRTFQLQLVEGRNFSGRSASDQSAILINETLAHTLGWKNAVGKTIERGGAHQVIGVVKDFHFASLHDNIEPLIITNTPWQGKFDYLAVYFSGVYPQHLLKTIKKQWKEIVPASPLDYWFLDDQFNQLYRSELRYQRGFLYSSILAIFLAILGMLGLVSFSVEQRRKEIGVRKVLGADMVKISALLSKDFLKLVALANVIAWPVAWYVMNQWLQDFANRIQINAWVLILAGLIALFIALLTVGLQSVKAALVNPVKNLRSE